MAACPSNKIDSNDTGLRFAIEKCLKTLPTLATDGADPVWRPLEPNSYGDMGANVTTVARNPINPSRQRQKGVVTDLEASASFQTDLTGKNHLYFLQSYLFALAREKPTTEPLNTAQVPITGVAAATGYAVADAFASTVQVGDLVFAEGFGVAANNGVKVVTSIAVGKVMVAGLTDEAAPPATATLKVVGVQAADADFAITVGADVRLTSVALDLTTLGLIPGEWIYIGGDTAASKFTNNQGFARVDAIGTNYLVLGKTSWTPVAEAGAAGKTVQIYLGTVIRNEDDPTKIVRSSLQFERTLGKDADGTQSQYIIGAVANEFTLNVPQAEKITAEMAFVACDAIGRTGLEGLKAGSRPVLEQSDAFNTSSDLRRVAFSIAGDTTPLFVYATDLNLKINNHASGAKALGVLGNFDINIGVFEVSGSVTAYFQDIRAVNAVRDNSDVTMDVIMVKNNIGLVWDVPLMALGNGMVAVEQDQSITVPLDTMAAQSSFGHTLLYVHFPYLPNAA